MKEVWVNRKLVDFTNAAKQNKMTPGCSLLEEEDEQMEDERDLVEDQNEASDDDDPCYDNDCKSGSTCVAKLYGGYSCKCQPGWTGVHCEIGQFLFFVFDFSLFFCWVHGLNIYFRFSRTIVP